MSNDRRNLTIGGFALVALLLGLMYLAFKIGEVIN